MVFRLLLFIAVIYIELIMGNTLYGEYYEIDWSGRFFADNQLIQLKPVLVVILCFGT